MVDFAPTPGGDIEIDNEAFKWQAYVQDQRRYGQAHAVVATMGAMLHTMDDERIAQELISANFSNDAPEQLEYREGLKNKLQALNRAFWQYMNQFSEQPAGDAQVKTQGDLLRKAIKDMGENHNALAVKFAVGDMVTALDVMEADNNVVRQVKAKIVPEDKKRQSDALVPAWWPALHDIKPDIAKS